MTKSIGASKTVSRAGVSKDKVAPASVAVTVRMPPALRDKAQRAANKDGRTLNNWVLQLVKKELA